MDLTFLSDVDADQASYARRQFVVVFTGEYANVDDLARFAVRNAQGRITDFPFLVAENSAEETFFRSQFRFTFRRNLTDQYVAREYVGTDHDDPFSSRFFVLSSLTLGISRVISSGAEFRIAGIAFIFFNMDRSIEVVLRQFFTEENGVFVVVAFPRHVSYEDVVTEG